MSPTVAGLIQLLALLLVLAAVWRPLGDWMHRVYTDPRHWRLEGVVYRLTGVNPDSEQRWSVYALSVLAFSAAGIVLLYVMQRLQGLLPLSGP